MSDHSLYKLFYIDRDLHKKEYERRFHDPNTISLGFSIGAYPAFLCLSPALYRRLLAIERADKRVHHLCHKLPSIAMREFTERCLLDEIILSNHIEGVQSSRKEITAALMDLSEKSRNRRFQGLTRKYVMLKNGAKIPMETCQDIRKLYDDIFYMEIEADDRENAPDGEVFRKNAVSVYAPTGKELHTGVMPESRIMEIMEEALSFLNDTTSPVDVLLRIAVFHYIFGYVHPFYDGNGRTSRFISSYLLSRELHPLIAFRLSFTIKESIHAYYEAFKICNHPNNRGDVTPFAEMFLEVVEKSIKQLCKALEKRLRYLEAYKAVIPQLPYSEEKDMKQFYYLLLQASLFSSMGISQSTLEQHTKMSYNSIRTRLKRIPPEFLIDNRQNRQPFYLLNLSAVDRYIQGAEPFGSQSPSQS